MSLRVLAFASLTTLLFALPACGSSDGDSGTTITDTTGDTTSDVAGDTAGSDTVEADTIGADAIAANGLTLASPFGVNLIQHPVKNPLDPAQSEGAVEGILSVRRKSAPVDTAEVTVNGVALVSIGNGDYEIPNTADVTGAAAGATLKVVVKDAGDTLTYDVPCPTEVVITAPVEDAAVTEGQSLTVAWTGVIGYDHPLLDPAFGLYRYHASSGTFLGYSPLDMPKVTATDTSVTVTLPENDKPQYVAELRIPGTFVATAKYDGIHCGLVRRVLLTNQP
jgi:hypothetical protein